MLSACRSFFRANVQAAQKTSYREVGYHLAVNLPSLIGGEVDDAVLEELDRLVGAEDAEGVVGWIERALPRCAALVPRARRRTSFLAGVELALENGRI